MRFQICAYLKNLSSIKLRKELQSCGFAPFRQNRWTKELRPLNDETNVIDFGVKADTEERDYFLFDTDSAMRFETALTEIMKNLNFISEYSVKFFDN